MKGLVSDAELRCKFLSTNGMSVDKFEHPFTEVSTTSMRDSWSSVTVKLAN